MLKVHRIVVFSLLLVVLSQGRLCAQRADDTINRALERLSRALIEYFNNLERREFRNRLAVLEFENGSENEGNWTTYCGNRNLRYRIWRIRTKS